MQGVCSKPGSMRSGSGTDQLDTAACALGTRNGRAAFRHWPRSQQGQWGGWGRQHNLAMPSLRSGWFGHHYCQTSFQLSVLNIDKANHTLKGFFYKNIRNTFSVSLINQCHLVLCISSMNSVAVASFHFLPISFSLLCIDKRFKRHSHLLNIKNEVELKSLEEQTMSIMHHYLLHCLWLLGLNLTKGFVRNQGQDPTFLKESIKQNKTHKIWGKKMNIWPIFSMLK